MQQYITIPMLVFFMFFETFSYAKCVINMYIMSYASTFTIIVIHLFKLLKKVHKML